jgi:hypothetical protein
MVTTAGQSSLRVAAMQPYFFPYLGYFQLMAACDVFVVRDEAQYIHQGWVNRNRILVNGGPQWVTLPVASGDHALPIRQRNYLLDHPVAKRLHNRITAAYRRAPQFDDAMSVVDEALSCRDTNVSAFNINLLGCIAKRLGIDTPVRLASTLPRQESLSGQEAVRDICVRLGASMYINPIGGLDLYNPALFVQHGLTLRFLESQAPDYSQFGAPFVPSLSVIDVMMFNDVATIRKMLPEYRLVKGRASETSPQGLVEMPLQ